MNEWMNELKTDNNDNNNNNNNRAAAATTTTTYQKFNLFLWLRWWLSSTSNLTSRMQCMPTYQGRDGNWAFLQETNSASSAAPFDVENIASLTGQCTRWAGRCALHMWHNSSLRVASNCALSEEFEMHVTSYLEPSSSLGDEPGV